MCACGKCMVKIGEDLSEKLRIIPALVWVDAHHYSKYGCPDANCPCSGDDSRPGVLTAQGPLPLIQRSMGFAEANPVMAALLALIWTAEFCDHLPFYRREAGFRRIEVVMSGQDMSKWTRKVTDQLAPLFGLIEKTIREGPVVQMDETLVTVLKLDRTGNIGQGYMGLAPGWPSPKTGDSLPPRPGRGNEQVRAFLGDFEG